MKNRYVVINLPFILHVLLYQLAFPMEDYEVMINHILNVSSKIGSGDDGD